MRAHGSGSGLYLTMRARHIARDIAISSKLGAKPVEEHCLFQEWQPQSLFEHKGLVTRAVCAGGFVYNGKFGR